MNPIQVLWFAWLLAGLAPTDSDLVPDDFVSVMCPSHDACFLLDSSGELFASADGAGSLMARTRLEGLKSPKILFAGTLHGWMLSGGDLWRSRDGGHHFEALARPEGKAVADMCFDDMGRLVLGTSDGWLYRHEAEARFGLRGPKVPGGISLLRIAADGSRLVVSGDGSLFVLRTGEKQWKRSRPLPRGALGAAWLGSTTLVATACKGQVRLSSDDGKTWRKPVVKGGASQPEAGVCLWPAEREAWGHALLLGAAGKVGLLDSVGNLRWLETKNRRTWRAAAPCGAGVLLVGDGGARGLLRREAGRFSYEQLGRVGSAFIAVGVLGKDLVYRGDVDGHLQWSDDGGQSWRSASAPRLCRQLQFVDGKRGFALVGDGALMVSADAGASWTELVRWDGLSMRDMHFVDARHGWVVGGRGAVARTADGGQNWTLDRAEFDRDFLAVRFLDAKRGWAVGERQAAFFSSDGGKSWIRRLEGRGTLRAVAVLDARRAFVAGDQGLVLETEDAGENWIPRPAPTDQALMDLAFINPLQGLAVGNEGRVFVTRDGGQAWTRLEGLATRDRFTRVACTKQGPRCFLGTERGWMLAGNPFR